MEARRAARSARITLPIHDVTYWEDAAQVIESALAAVAGVRSVYVNPAMEMAYLQFDPERCCVEDLARAVRRAGFLPGEGIIR